MQRNRIKKKRLKKKELDLQDSDSDEYEYPDSVPNNATHPLRFVYDPDELFMCIQGIDPSASTLQYFTNMIYLLTPSSVPRLGLIRFDMKSTSFEELQSTFAILKTVPIMNPIGMWQTVGGCNMSFLKGN
jgi:hypothetical protein